MTVNLILQDRIEEGMFFCTVALGPVLLISGTKDPAAIVLRFKDKDSFLMDQNNIDLCCMAFVWQINIVKASIVSLYLMMYKKVFQRVFSELL
jgi:hypothetical protein